MRLATIKHSILMSAITMILLAADMSAFANTFDITSRIYVDGKLMSTPRVITEADQKSWMTVGDLKIDFVAKDTKNGDIDIRYEISYQGDKKTKHVMTPRLILASGEPGSIGFSNATHTVQINVLAKKQ